MSSSKNLEVMGFPASGCIRHHSHLFFDCSVTNSIWSFVKSKCAVQWPQINWSNLMNGLDLTSKANLMPKPEEEFC